jgi:hypothetical protein
MSDGNGKRIEVILTRVVLGLLLLLSGRQTYGDLTQSADFSVLKKDVTYLVNRVERIESIVATRTGETTTQYADLLQKYYELRSCLQAMTPEAAKNIARIEKIISAIEERVRALEQK